MIEETRPVGETRDAVLVTIDAAGLGSWTPPALEPGFATVPTSRLMRVVASRLLGRSGATPDG